MAKQLVKKGDTSRIEYIFVQNSSSTTGAGLTGLVFNSAGLTAYYVRTQGSATAITLATQTVTGAFSSGGFVEVDATNMPGIYRVDIPDAVFATGADKAALLLKGATNMAPVALEYQLVDFDPEDAAGLGLSRLDAAVTTRLAPTTAGRTLDVTATGAAGIDWANVEGQTTAVTLSSTTVGTATAVTTVNGLAANVITAASMAADAGGEIADAVWDEARAGHVTAGSFGEGVASVQGNVTGSVASVTAGVTVAVGGIAATSFAAGAIDAAAIAADAITSSELAQSAAQEIADEILNRDLAGGASGNTRNVRNALRSLRNKAAIAAGTLTVYQEDDATAAWTAAVSTTAGDPISSIDPAGP